MSSKSKRMRLERSVETRAVRVALGILLREFPLGTPRNWIRDQPWGTQESSS